MAVKVKYSVNCDECGRYGGDAETRKDLREKLRRSGWIRRDGKEICARHRIWPAGTEVTVTAGVKPIGQGRTHQGCLSLVNGPGQSIWECGHLHKATGTGEDRAPWAAWDCAKAYAESQGWIVIDVEELLRREAQVRGEAE